VDAERPARDPLAERLAFDPFHHQEELAARGLAVREIPDDAGIPELCEHGRLAGEARALLRPGDGENLDRAALTVAIARAIHGAHRTGARARLDHVVADELPDPHRSGSISRRVYCSCFTYSKSTGRPLIPAFGAAI